MTLQHAAALRSASGRESRMWSAGIRRVTPIFSSVIRTRCTPHSSGRGTGFSFLEQPQLVSGDKTVLQANMVFAVDGSVSTPTFRAQVGDSFILNDQGHEQITRHPTSVEEVIIKN